MMRTRVSKVVEIFSTIAEEFDLIHANPYSQIMPCHDGGFQLEFVSISRVINHMTCYKLSALIG